MSDMPNLTARRAALEVLLKINLKAHDCSEILKRYYGRTSQKQQATDITYGVVRNLSLIDFVLNKLCSVVGDRVSKKVFNALRIGAYEIIFSASAEYAIVNECVNLVQNRKERGFVNAVLRNILRAIDQRSIETTDLFNSKIIPTSSKTGCLFVEPILPMKDGKEVEFLSKAFSLPRWLVRQWIEDFGLEKTVGICYGSNRKPSIYLRPNLTKTTAQSLMEMFAKDSVEAQLDDEGMICLLSSCAIKDLPGFEEGLFSVQDKTAAKVARLVNPQAGSAVADLCSAPGTKTTHLAELMGNSGVVYATDKDSERLKKVSENAQRLGLDIIQCIDYESAFDQLREIKLDAVLLDVPCSNTGVMAKRCELRHRITKKGVSELAAIQMEILQRTADELTDCPVICYSTCSILLEENSQLIQQFLLKNPDFVLKQECLSLPSDVSLGNDGGYVAVLCRKA